MTRAARLIAAALALLPCAAAAQAGVEPMIRPGARWALEAGAGLEVMNGQADRRASAVALAVRGSRSSQVGGRVMLQSVNRGSASVIGLIVAPDAWMEALGGTLAVSAGAGLGRLTNSAPHAGQRGSAATTIAYTGLSFRRGILVLEQQFVAALDGADVVTDLRRFTPFTVSLRMTP